MKFIQSKGGYLDEVSESLSGAPGGGKDIINPSKLKHLFGNSSGNNPGSTWSRDHTNRD